VIVAGSGVNAGGGWIVSFVLPSTSLHDLVVCVSRA
jgi:hypothetical protein